MNEIPRKFDRTIEESVSRLLGKATDNRGCTSEEVRARVEASIRKFFPEEPAQHAEIINFVEDIRIDELCLILACERGDEKAWEDLVREFDATVKSAAHKITSRPEDAEDLASSIWAELYGLKVDLEGKRRSKLAYFSGRGSLGGWLRAVTAQLAIDRHRKTSRMVQVEEDRELENLAEEAGGRASSILQHAENSEEILLAKDASDAVTAAFRAAIEGIDAEDRLILKLYYFDDNKLKDIAAAFGFHEATASRKLAKIHVELRKKVEAALKRECGWSEKDIKETLAEASKAIGTDIEKMLAGIAVLLMVQELWR